MSGMKGKLSNLALMALMMGAHMGNPITPKEIDVTQKEPVIPKGCKQYWFNESGRFFNYKHDLRNTESIFYCIASSDKKAIEKFKKHQLCTT